MTDWFWMPPCGSKRFKRLKTQSQGYAWMAVMSIASQAQRGIKPVNEYPEDITEHYWGKCRAYVLDTIVSKLQKGCADSEMVEKLTTAYQAMTGESYE